MLALVAQTPAATSTHKHFPTATSTVAATAPAVVQAQLPTTTTTTPLHHTVLAFEATDPVLLSATLESICNTSGPTVRDVSSAAHYLLGFFPRNTDPTVADAMTRVAAEPTTDFITAANALLRTLRLVHSTADPDFSFPWFYPETPHSDHAPPRDTYT